MDNHEVANKSLRQCIHGGTLFFMVIWVVLFLVLPRCRMAMWWTGLVFSLAGPAGEFWSLKDYWHPYYYIDISIRSWRFGIEDLLMSFALAGISAGLFEHLALKKGLSQLPRVSFKTVMKMMGLGTVGLFLIVFLIRSFRLNSVHAQIAAAVITSSLMIMIFSKREVLFLILPVSVIFGLLFWLYYLVFFIPVFPGVIEKIWDFQSASGIMLAGVPIEELLWAFATVLFTGPVFRVCSVCHSHALRS